MRFIKELVQEDSKLDAVLKHATPVAHQHDILRAADKNIPKTPDDDQLVHRRRSIQGECSTSAVEIPFIISLDDGDAHQDVQVLAKNGTDRTEKDLNGPGLELDDDEDNSLFTSSIMDSIEYKVRCMEKGAFAVARDRETSSVRIPLAVVKFEYLLSDWSDVSESDEDFLMPLKETFASNHVVLKHLKSSTETGPSRCIHNVSSYVEVNPAA